MKVKNEGPAVAVIPARGGSKGVPAKNLTRVGGKSLVARAIEAAHRAPGISRVYVTTDDETIADAALHARAEVIMRPPELASDTSSSEAALLHACGAVTRSLGEQPQVLAFLQATSPFIDSRALGEAISKVNTGEFDSVFSAIETYEFLWRGDNTGVFGVNHQSSVRPRRQDREPDYRETGAFYVVNWCGFLEKEHRFFGRIGVQKVSERESIEIDSFEELEIARAIAPLVATHDAGEPIRDISALVTDFDGVHTNDSALVTSEGIEGVTVSRSDGMGIELLRNLGYPLLIISKEKNPVVTQRAEKLKIDVIQGCEDKASALHGWARDLGIPLDRIAYVGNDINDLPPMRQVGWPIAVSDAHPKVLSEARICLTRPGGNGALRELADMIINSTKGHDYE
ncbi:MAG: acylneuraminate cytidylyltransferase [Gordonia sp.]|nr:acylneuraminate cytidylyltransferase [Gordonia sp. (in: high G+C Gram-positive bacteria)]